MYIPSRDLGVRDAQAGRGVPVGAVDPGSWARNII